MQVLENLSEEDDERKTIVTVTSTKVQHQEELERMIVWSEEEPLEVRGWLQRRGNGSCKGLIDRERRAFITMEVDMTGM